MVTVLKKLTQGALLSPSEASEEYRDGIVRCFRALLTRLEPCQDMFCSCKQVSGSSSLLSKSDICTKSIDLAEHGLCSKECLLTFLRSQSASAIVGHWLSLLLQVRKSSNIQTFISSPNHFLIFHHFFSCSLTLIICTEDCGN